MQKLQEMRVWSLGGEDPLEEGRATHSRILGWRIPWTEEPGGSQSMGLQRVGHNWSDLVHTHAQLSDWATTTRKMPWTWPKVFPDTSLPLNSGIVCWVPALAGLTVSGLWVFSGSLLPPPCWCSSSGLYSESLALTSISLGVFVLSLRSPLWVSLSWVSPTSCWVVPPNIGVILVVTQMCSMLNSPLLNLGNQEEAYLEPLGRYFHRLGRVVPKWKECGFGVRPGFASWLHCLITLASYLPALSLHFSLFPVWIISMLQGHCENWVVRHCV